MARDRLGQCRTERHEFDEGLRFMVLIAAAFIFGGQGSGNLDGSKHAAWLLHRWFGPRCNR
jgi:hypothetical protein